MGELGTAIEVVLSLDENTKEKNLKVLFDNTITFLEKLNSQGIEATGSCQANQHIAAQAKLKDQKYPSGEGRETS